MLFPYRAKNPPERFPALTLGLIIANVLIYACTSDLFLSVRDGVVRDLAVSHQTLSLFRLITAMFLHADPFHLAGNMLFLWIFGSAIEGRLGSLKYGLVYVAAGLAGGLLQDVVVGLAHPKVWNLGASGAIMGLAGAYLFMFPFATICVFFAWGFRMRLMEWQAQWVVGYFVAFDVFYGMLFKGAGLMDGVGHFCHLGGFGAGFLAVLLLRAKRDSEDLSNAQAVRSDTAGNYGVLALHELETLAENNTANVPLLMAFCRKAATQYDGSGQRLCYDALLKHQRLLGEQGDPDALAKIAFALPPTLGPLPSAFLLRLAGRLESQGDYEWASRVYRHLHQSDPQGRDTEMALFRLARLTEQMSPDKKEAAAVYAQMTRLFPRGALVIQAQDALRRLGGGAPTIVFSAGNAAAAAPGGDRDLAPVQRAAPAAPARDIVHDVNKAASDDLRLIGG